MNYTIVGSALVSFLPIFLGAMDSRVMVSCTLEKESGVVTYASHLYRALLQQHGATWLVLAEKSPLSVVPKRYR